MGEKSVSPVHPRSLKAASSILKSLGSLGLTKSQLTNPRSGSQSPRSIHKSVSIVDGNPAAPKESGKIPRMESSKLSGKDLESSKLSGKDLESSKLSGKDLDSLHASEDIERELTISIADSKTGKFLGSKRRANKLMRKYPELFRDDVSINPSYTGLRNFPYNVVCRRRFHKNKSKINRQLNREIESITMMQTVALDGVRVGRIFTVGFHPKETIVPDFATPRERVKNGYIKRVTDDEVKSLVLEIAGTNVATTFISCPQDPKKVLGIKLPFLIMIIKNMKKYFTFEITILDDKDMHRRFRVSNFQSTTRVRPFCTTMPIGLSGGWNQIQFNLADFTRRAYGSNYIETTRMQIHANCRIRRIYYADRLYSEDEMPEEFKLFLPIRRRGSTREDRTSITNNKKKIEEERLAGEPPQFATQPAGEESRRLESGAGNNLREELGPENSQDQFEIAQRMSETRRGSDSDPRKSLSAMKHEGKGKSVGVTIRGRSKDEIIASDKEEGIATVDEDEEKEEEEEDFVGVEERLEDGEPRVHDSDGMSPQQNLENEETFEIGGNVTDEG